MVRFSFLRDFSPVQPEDLRSPGPSASSKYLKLHSSATVEKLDLTSKLNDLITPITEYITLITGIIHVPFPRGWATFLNVAPTNKQNSESGKCNANIQMPSLS